MERIQARRRSDESTCNTISFDPRRAILLELLDSEPTLSNVTQLLRNDPLQLAVYQSYTNVTLFLSNNDAFASFNRSPVASELRNVPTARAGLQYVSVNGTYPLESFRSEPKYFNTNLVNRTFTHVEQGAYLGAAADENGYFVRSGGGARSNITEGDLFFNGGVVHVLDRLTTAPQNISATARALQSDFLAAVARYGIDVSRGDNATLLAPTNEAWAAALAEMTKSGDDQGPPQDRDIYDLLIKITRENTIRGHVVLSEAFGAPRRYINWFGRALTFSDTAPPTTPSVNGFTIERSDLFVDFGVLHLVVAGAVNKVPPPAQDEE
ncbi:MAG: hypothetical protein M1817_001795 [Caeruleum heppii]|nr:MAG: hypothetical protein M1817_001795 [Caeruleum heppii]